MSQLARITTELITVIFLLGLLILAICAIRAAIEPNEYQPPITFEEYWSQEGQ